MSSSIPSSLFHTDLLPIKKREESYRESMGVIFDIDGIDKNPDFHARIEGHLISDMMLVDCQTVSQNFLRPLTKIAQDGVDHFLIQIYLDGKQSFKLKHGEIYHDPSQLLVIDASRPWNARTSNFRNLSLIIPRRLLRLKLWDEDSHHGRLLNPKENPFAQFLSSHILTLRKTVGEIECNLAHSLITPTLELVAMTLNYASQKEGGKQGDPEVLSTRSFLFRIKSFVEENLSNPDLNMEMIRAEFNLTRSTLYRLFPSDGGVMKYVRERRLKKAYKILTMQSPGETIAKVAFGAGFENESSFTRAFKNYFGISPREAKARQELPSWSDESPERAWESWLRSL